MVIFAHPMNLKTLKKYLLFLLTILISGSVFSQRRGNTAWTKYRHEASIGYGVNTLFANLGERDNWGVNYVLQRSVFNGSYRYYALKNLAVRGSISHAYARKNDKGFEVDDSPNTRIDYQATLTEFSAIAEWHFIDETTKGKKKKVRRARGGMSKGLNVGLSLFTGLGMSYLRPYGEYFGEAVEFKPITDPLTVPNTDRYNRWNLFFPVGGQARMILTENWRVGLELGYRIGLREYIDNVSGVYYRDPSVQKLDSYEDPQKVGEITFSKEKAPIADLASETGKRNYFFGLVTLSYRIKS